MPPRGRPPNAGTAEEKAAAKRERVRNNVRALRLRRKEQSALLKQGLGGDLLQLPWTEGKPTQTTPTEESTEGETPVSSSNNEIQSSQVSRCPSKDEVYLPVSLGPGSVHAAALVANVRIQFLPDSVYLPPSFDKTNNQPWDSKEILWTPCAFWINSAFSRASTDGNSLLKQTLVAVGTLLKSIEFHDPALRAASLDIFGRCITGIRKALLSVINGEPPGDVTSLFLTCHAAAMYELCQTSDMRGTMWHLRGVSRLICHLGVEAEPEAQAKGWLFLQDYRHAELGLCLKYRYLSYSSEAERRFNALHAGKKDGTAITLQKGRRNLLVRVVDLGDEVCYVMVKLDNMKVATTPENVISSCDQLVKKLKLTWSKFQHVYDQLKARYGSAFVFPDKDADGLGGGSVKFKTYDIGCVWCYCLMVQLYCVATQIDVMSFALEQEQAELASTEEQNSDWLSLSSIKEARKDYRRICIQLSQCILYFLQTDKGITGTALAIFPLDAVSEMLDTELARLQNDRSTAESSGAGQDRIVEIETDFHNLMRAKELSDGLEERARELGMRSVEVDS